jgi:hypothetical protein
VGNVQNHWKCIFVIINWKKKKKKDTEEMGLFFLIKKSYLH